MPNRSRKNFTPRWKGNRDAALALLAADVAISGGGHTQTGKNTAGHLAEDIASMKAADITPRLARLERSRRDRDGRQRDEIHATVKGEPRDFRSREMLTLKRESGLWKIAAIQWQLNRAVTG